MPSFLKIPKVQLAATLILIYLLALKQYPTLSSVYMLIASLGFTLIFDLLFTYLRRKQLFLPLSGVVSALIIALLVDPQVLWYQIAAICAMAMASKNFIRVEGKHIFNPAAFGLLLGGLVFNLPVAWWGASFQDISTLRIDSILSFLFLLTPALISFYKMKRFGSILSFLFLYNLLSGFKLIFDPTTIFFALVMLPEPMTSPFNLKKQVIYGVIVAISALILSYLTLLPDVLIPALLIGNLFNFFFKQK